VEHDYDFKEDAVKDRVKKELRLPCRLNLAAVNLRLKEWKQAIEHSSKALEIDGSNVKALFRRGSAYLELDDWELARSDLEKALSHDSANKDVQKELTRLKDKIKTQNNRDRKAYAGMFDKVFK